MGTAIYYDNDLAIDALIELGLSPEHPAEDFDPEDIHTWPWL